MIKYLVTDPWKIVEEGFKRKHHRSSESIFSIGNGRFGQRANHEEKFTGPSLQGSYVAGVYYPDKTRVGWWKNGYPEYFAKVLNSTNWIGIHVWVDEEEVDFATCITSNFRRELNMKEGYLQRSFDIEMPSGKQVHIEATRFCSMADDETAAIRYSVTPLNFMGMIKFQPYLDGDVKNHDSNYDEKFWEPIHHAATAGEGIVVTRTRKTEFDVATAMKVQLFLKGKEVIPSYHFSSHEFFAENNFEKGVNPGETITLYKYVGVVSSLNYDKSNMAQAATNAARRAFNLGFENMLAAQREKWAEIWKLADIVIEGDDEAQQAIRFNIFHLNQTYTGEDSRLNIGPKGFTGEKYGGSTYWDTEAYCIPFYMSTKDQKVARQLLTYRFNQLPRAIENAAKLGFTNGAALYPMVTMNGEECHNEWEITFEEIHRNGAIAYAIYNYTRYTGDTTYFSEGGIDVLIGIARFWAQRVHWSASKKQYVMHGVTGPNEYENNVNNNWYTSYIATWCMKYCLEVIDYLRKENPSFLSSKLASLSYDESDESVSWRHIIDHMYYGKLEGTEIYLQQDGFMDKVLMKASELSPAERPINQHWSWDRILRSCFIKQADVLQGIYFFEEDFSLSEIKTNFDFYEPMTVHESSLSPCVHSILAAKLGYDEKAYEMYMRTSRLDLDDYNHEAHEGLHITSMAGTWMSIVQGFGGMRVVNDQLEFKAMLPKQWKSYSFNVLFRGKVVQVKVDAQGVTVN
ncbi:MAG: glycoside hydrolase family 65 protein [Flavobacteriales bacterium]|nr:glycoside hydrolase family 65 protein [Flavobacteriales bacterium]